MTVSNRVAQICPSTTLAITAKAKKMKAEGVDVVGFGAGEPDFDTPTHIKEAAIKAMMDGFTKYTPASGTAELKQAICKKFKQDNGLDYLPEEIIVSCGAKHSIFNVILALCNDGDEVLLPSPYWVSYPEMIKVAGSVPVILEATQESDFKITPQQLRDASTPKTKLLILNSPSNPTGMVYSKDELEAIAAVLTEKGIYCISDEIYEKILYDGQAHVSIAALSPAIKELTLVINGVSKSYSMTGWRIGYTAGPKPIIKAMSDLQSHSTSNPTSFAQSGALAALEGPQEFMAGKVAEFLKRRDYVVERLNSISGVTCLKPQGAFYVFPDVSKLFGKSVGGQTIKNADHLAELLLSEAAVAVVPGGGFGAEQHLRLSYALSMENIVKGLDRIVDFLSRAA